MKLYYFLNLINDIRRKILFAAVWAYITGDIFNRNKFSFVPLSICDMLRGGFAMTDRTFIHDLVPPNFVVNPFFRIRFVSCYNTYNWMKAYLDMQGSSFFSFAVYQTAWSIFIRRIIFDYLAIRNDLSNFFRTNISINSLFNTMFSIPKSFINKYLADFFNFHTVKNYIIEEVRCQCYLTHTNP